MIIHVFNDRENLTQELSPTASSMYPIYIRGKIVANILSDGDSWTVKLTEDYRSNDSVIDAFKLEEYHVYSIVSKTTNEVLYLVSTPRYNQNTQTFALSNQVLIGSSPICDICYPLPHNNTDTLKLTLTKYGWIAETSSRSFFASDTRIVNGQRILCGDYISYYGLKLIILNNKVILNSPAEYVKIGARLVPTEQEDPSAPIALPEGSSSDEDAPLYTEEDYYYKSPRFNYTIETAQVNIDEPPAETKPSDMPLIATLGPQLTMACASMLSIVNMVMAFNQGSGNEVRLYLSISTMVITMVGILLWPSLARAISKKRLKKREAKRQVRYHEYLGKKKQHLDFIKNIQKQTLLNNNPTMQQCAEIIGTRNERLWQRNIDHDDFLKIRVGLGEVETKLEINKPAERFTIDEEDNLRLELRKIVNDSLTITDAPITYDFTDQIIDAVMGDPSLVKPFLDSVFLQILTFHSYTDLKFVVFTNEPEKWDYLKTIPHCWNNERTVRYFATSVEKLSIISNDLEKVFDARKANDEEEKLEDDGDNEVGQKTNYKDFRPYYLFFIDDMSAVRNVPLINKILHYKRNLGFSIIATAQSISMLPSETSDFISITKERAAIMTTGENEKQINFNADYNNNLVDMYVCAQKLANIPVKTEKGKFELPKSLPFLEMYDCGRVEQLNSLARWKDNDPSQSLSVPIGIDQNNESFRMDIHEKAYGPHGLIAGTTGSGKSEWIISYILSLATNFSPNEVQFVLIDYKGGGLAKSFENKELGIKLPHLAGTITNLDKSEIFRSISAIESELKRRQALFNDAREKLREASMDIYKYQQCYRKGLVDEPLSHLLIICDEFAELKQQEPEFMDQLISTSRIGRSLGVHLILATQKPSGVVNEQIWSNSKFKVALKVQNKSDSNEIIKKPDAAYLKQTGAFYLQVGNDDYYNLGQVAWAGAKYYPSNEARHKIDESIQCIDEIGHIVDTLKHEEHIESQGEQLLNVVSYISNISKKIEIKSRPMWLENIQPKMLLAELQQKYNLQPSPKYTYNTVIGEYDEPREQKQGVLSLDLAAGNIAIIGKADGSIDRLISTTIWSSICERTPAEIAYYIIDFGAETLKKFAKFPQVGEVVFQDETEKVAGVVNMIVEEVARRKEILSDYNGSFEYYNRTVQEKMNLIVVVINNYDILSEAFPRAVGIIGDLFRDAPKYGITFIISANTTTAISSRLSQFFNHMILMQLNDDGQYRGLSQCRRGLIPKKVIGRGICKLDATSVDSYCEFQTAMIDEEEKELQTIKTYADECVEAYKCKVKQLAKIPDDITSDDLINHISTLTNVPLGINLYEKNLASYDFVAQKMHIITSKDINANIEFVYALATLLTKVPNVKVRVLDLLKIFKKPILDIQMFDQDPNVVFAALEKDVLTRTDAQDYGVNIIIGAGQYKNKLSQGGIEIFKNMFEHIKDSKKSVYVLIDNYDNIRTLKLEKWYRDIDTSQGIWLGPGLESQSIFENIEVRNEDKKHGYKGLGFMMTGGDYSVMKVMMDKDE